MIQNILILILFVLAVGFIFRKIFNDFSAKDSCAKGCASCDISSQQVDDKSMKPDAQIINSGGR